MSICPQCGQLAYDEHRRQAEIMLTGVILHVANVECSVAFYRQLPGAQLIFHKPSRFAWLRFGTSHFGLMRDTKQLCQLEIDCADLDSAGQKFQELGIQIEKTPVFRGPRYHVLVSDPDGNLVELTQRRDVSAPPSN